MKASSAVLLFLVALLAIWAELPSAAAERKDICRLPKVEGNCLALFRRWFFNWATRKCEAFVYGGCHGNKNNFETLEECLRACGHHALPPRTPGKCPKPQGPGLCVENCTSDKSCGPGEKCCSNGCGHDCVKVTGGSY
ncbi:chelonianin [Anolis carolinensis]|uniref:chelonianin n=1 Tax=Anolis carolinensis TaxID=28377 RepID=UPI002F2B44D7